jgi:hypothetical protein
MNPYQRQVREYLRSVYGVTPTMINGGNHQAYEFDFGGKRRRITLHGEGQRNDKGALAMKLQDIRRELGTPPPQPTRAPRKLENMMSWMQSATVPKTEPAIEPAPAAAPAKPPHMGAMALYFDVKNRLRFFVPSDLRRTLSGTLGIEIARIGHDSWELSPSHTRRRSFNKDGYVEARDESCIKDLEPFGMSPAEFIEVDGHVIASIDLTKVNSIINKNNSKKKDTAIRRDEQERVTVSPAPSLAVGQVVSGYEDGQDRVIVAISPEPAPTATFIPDDFNTQAERALDLIATVEAAGYHLAKDKTTQEWAFFPNASVIRRRRS